MWEDQEMMIQMWVMRILKCLVSKIDQEEKAVWEYVEFEDFHKFPNNRNPIHNYYVGGIGMEEHLCGCPGYPRHGFQSTLAFMVLNLVGKLELLSNHRM